MPRLEEGRGQVRWGELVFIEEAHIAAMAWIAIFLAISVAAAVWVWGRAAQRRRGSHAELPSRTGISPSPTLDAGDRPLSNGLGGAAVQEEEVHATTEPAEALSSLVEIAAPPAEPAVETITRAGAPWVEGAIEIEPGLGVACAKANHYKDQLFIQAQTHLKKDLNLFLISKDDRDVVLRKECGLLLASRLADLETNGKIQDAYALGVPVLLAEDVGDCAIGDMLKVHFSPAQLQEYQRIRSAFEAQWELVPYQLKGNDKYFLTHSDAGYKLLNGLEVYLEQALGPRQEIKSQSVSKKVELDFVVVPTLRTTSSKFLSVLARETPVLAIRSPDLEGRGIGDEVPAWRWKGGEFFMYPPMKRARSVAHLPDH